MIEYFSAQRLSASHRHCMGPIFFICVFSRAENILYSFDIVNELQGEKKYRFFFQTLSLVDVFKFYL